MTASLTCCVWGLQVVQKMFEFGTVAQKARLVSTMEGQVLGLSLQMYGCRVVQKVCGIRAFNSLACHLHLSSSRRLST